MVNKNWKIYLNKKVRLIINDYPYPVPKDGIFRDIDHTHIFLEIAPDKTIPFERSSVKRVEFKKEEQKENGTEET